MKKTPVNLQSSSDVVKVVDLLLQIQGCLEKSLKWLLIITRFSSQIFLYSVVND